MMMCDDVYYYLCLLMWWICRIQYMRKRERCFNWHLLEEECTHVVHKKACMENVTCLVRPVHYVLSFFHRKKTCFDLYCTSVYVFFVLIGHPGRGHLSVKRHEYNNIIQYPVDILVTHSMARPEGGRSTILYAGLEIRSELRDNFIVFNSGSFFHHVQFKALSSSSELEVKKSKKTASTRNKLACTLIK